MENTTPIRIATLEAIISKASGVSIENMRSHSRDHEYVDARMAVWLVAHDHMGYSFPRIAEIYQRDHTTIISGVRKLRASKDRLKILEGIQKNFPGKLKEQGHPQTTENWRF